ncbi:MAG: hypothetical protein NDI73_00700 [Desulfuromonadales bacterium]|nr:hypothetical protein [Desulfuromonadales bacterium]
MTIPAARLVVPVLTLILAGVPCATALAEPAPGTVRGCVEMAGHTSYCGVAALWPAGEGKAPDPRRAIRPPAVSRALASDGCFSLQAAPGEYFVGAIVRLTEGGWQGPPRPGDMIFLSPDTTDKNVVVTIRSDETVDIGCHPSGWTYSGFASTGAALTISGQLTGIDGKPRQGLLVFAFADIEMSKEPVAVSEPSDSIGRYLLRLPEPATVYLRAREHFGRRSPADGGYMGMYGKDAPIPVTVGADGDKQDRNLTIYLIPPLSGRQKQVTESSPRQKKN